MTDTAIVRVDDATTKAELEEAITHLNETAKRLPKHWVDRKTAVHDRINALLDERDLR